MRRRRTVAVGAAAGVVLLATGGVAIAQTRDGGGEYRTATATVGDVDRTVALSGTVAASSRRDLTFGSEGTVADVEVRQGDEVEAGDTLASLDPTDLEAAVTRAEADVAKARAQLESDRSAQAAAVEDAAADEPLGGGADAGSEPSPELREALAALREQQAAVTAARTAATEAITAAKAAVAAQAEACAATEGCAEVLAAAQAAQDVVATRQDELQTALTALGQTLTRPVGAVGTGSAPSGSASAGSDDDATPSAGTGSRSGGGGATPTASTLAQDQAAIDTAEARLTEAELARDAADLTAPFDGEVLAVQVSTGDDVAATDVAVILVGQGATTVTTSVTVDQVADVAKGQTAQVTPAGADEPVAATVSEVGVLPTGGDTVTYPVTLALDAPTTAPEGAGATVSLVTGTVRDAVTVPSSAVSRRGVTTVSVLQDGEPRTTPVTVGVVGTTRTSITEGLEEGDVVVLADLSAALPSGDSSTQRGLGGLGGGGFGGPGVGGPPMTVRRAG